MRGEHGSFRSEIPGEQEEPGVPAAGTRPRGAGNGTQTPPRPGRRRRAGSPGVEAASPAISLASRPQPAFRVDVSRFSRSVVFPTGGQQPPRPLPLSALRPTLHDTACQTPAPAARGFLPVPGPRLWDSWVQTRCVCCGRHTRRALGQPGRAVRTSWNTDAGRIEEELPWLSSSRPEPSVPGARGPVHP